MESAPLAVGVAAAVALVVAYLFHRRKYVTVLQTVAFTAVGGLIPPTVYALYAWLPGALFWLGVPLAAALALLWYVTRDPATSWAATVGVRGVQVWLAILLGSAAGYGLLLKYDQVLWYHWLAVLFGVLVGGSEILTRYQDEPWESLLSVPGVFYQAINGLIAAGAYWLLEHYHDKLFPALEGDPFLTAVVAGFGAMVVMRSKLFSFKTAAGEEVAVGPDAVITAFLRAVDRAIDRLRALKRQAIVLDAIDGIEYSPVVSSFFLGSLAAYANLSAAEKATLAGVINQVAADPNLDPRLKLMAMAFGFLNISGDGNFGKLIEGLKAFLKTHTATAVTPPATVAAGAGARVVNLAATVTGQAGPVTGGTVTFTVVNAAGATVGTAVTSAADAAGTAAAAYTLPAGTPAGAYTVRATYNPGNLSGSAGTAPLTVQ